MNNLAWLLRARRWIENPPPMRQVILIVAVIAVCVTIVVLDRSGLWPDWARLSEGRMPRLPR